jgi:hypothetical protein
MDKYHPGYFGKVGMRYFHKQGNHFWKPVINLDKVCAVVVFLLCCWDGDGRLERAMTLWDEGTGEFVGLGHLNNAGTWCFERLLQVVRIRFDIHNFLDRR